ncbi:MAG: hypothetical protein ABI600_01065 [Luteolibacter sp.]
MKPTPKRLLAALAVLCIWLVVSRWEWKKVGPPDADPPPPTPSVLAPPPVPSLLPARRPTPEHPANSWERLLAADGSPVEDRAALQDIVTSYLQSAPDNIRPPLGTNDEITHAIMDRDTLGDSAIPASHPAIVSGRLVDRWGSPWFFHQLSADVIEVRSAGPDRKLFSTDDVVK